MGLAQRFNVNTQAANGTASGTNLSMNDIIPIQPVTKGTAADDEKVTIQQLQSIPYGTAALSGTTYTVTLINYPMDYSLRVGSKMLVKFNSAKSGSSALNLSINGSLIPMLMQGVQMSEIAANQIIEFTFIGTIVNGVHTITGANASAGVTSSQVNSALTDYTKIETITDANNGIPPLYQSKEYFMQSGTNRPASARCFIVSKRDTYGSGEATQVIIQSAFISDPNNSPYSAQYYRRALSTNNGSTWTWGEWQQLATESSVNTTLGDYSKCEKFTPKTIPTTGTGSKTFTWELPINAKSIKQVHIAIGGSNNIDEILILEFSKIYVTNITEIKKSSNITYSYDAQILTVTTSNAFWGDYSAKIITIA